MNIKFQTWSLGEEEDVDSDLSGLIYKSSLEHHVHQSWLSGMVKPPIRHQLWHRLIYITKWEEEHDTNVVKTFEFRILI